MSVCPFRRQNTSLDLKSRDLQHTVNAFDFFFFIQFLFGLVSFLTLPKCQLLLQTKLFPVQAVFYIAATDISSFRGSWCRVPSLPLGFQRPCLPIQMSAQLFPIVSLSLPHIYCRQHHLGLRVESVWCDGVYRPRKEPLYIVIR